MSFIKKFIEQETINRRDFIMRSAVFGAGAAATTVAPTLANAADAPTLAWGYRTPDNPYWNAIVSGGTAMADSVSLPLTHLINGGSNEKAVSDSKALAAKTKGNCAIAIDPNDSPNCRAVVEGILANNGYVGTLWNKTDDLHPWDFGDNYVAHITWSDFKPSQKTAQILMDAIGGKGKIVGVGGMASNVPAIERKNGLLEVLKKYPNVELLDYQAADWSTAKAADLMSTYLTRFGDDITGIFSANDSMTLGILEALRAEGLDGQIPIVSYDGTPDVVKLVMDGTVECTVSTNPYWGGGILLSLAYYARIGKFKPSDAPKEHREFYGPAILITKKDAAEWKKNNIDKIPAYDWTKFWALSNGGIEYK